MNRAEVLDMAKAHVTVDRQGTHGKPENTLGLIAQFWSAYLGTEIAPHDVAAMMVLLKVARSKQNSQHLDNWVDGAGYFAIGAEMLGEAPDQFGI